MGRDPDRATRVTGFSWTTRRPLGGVWVGGTDDTARRVASWCRDAKQNVMGLVATDSNDALCETPHERVIDWRDLPNKQRDRLLVLAAPAVAMRDTERLFDLGWRFAGVSHPNSSLARDVSLDLAVVGPGVVIGTGACLWRHVFVDADAVIGADVVLEDGVRIGAGAVVGRGTRVIWDTSVPPRAVFRANALVSS